MSLYRLFSSFIWQCSVVLVRIAVCAVAGSVAIAQDADESAPIGFGNIVKDGRSSTRESSTTLDYQTDLFTGSFGYSIPIEAPPARNNSHPKLHLVYNSSSGYGWCGMGWSLDLGYIERETRKGVPVKWSGSEALTEYDDAAGFVCNLGGSETRLVLVPSGEYRAALETRFLKFQFIDNRWVVTAKDGTKYYYGQTGASRAVNPKPGWPQGTEPVGDKRSTFRWHLDLIVDPNGNKTEFTYFKDNGHVYPAGVLYSGNINSPQIAPACRIDFDLEPAARPDVRISFQSGFRDETRRRLTVVRCSVGSELVRQYTLAYLTSPSTHRSLLQSVQVRDGTTLHALPAVTFEYTVQPPEFGTETPWPGVWDQGTKESEWGSIGFGIPDTFSAPRPVRVRLADIDADGLPDRIMRHRHASVNELLAQRNTGSAFSPAGAAHPWAPLAEAPLDGEPATSRNRWPIEATDLIFFQHRLCAMTDMDGDFLPDRVGPNAAYTAFLVQRNRGVSGNLAFESPPSTWNNVLHEGSYDAPDGNGLGVEWGYGQYVTLLDINGDGLPDRVSEPRPRSSARFTVQLNTGAGFNNIIHWGPLKVEKPTWNPASYPGWFAPVNFNGDAVYRSHCVNVALIDINGDGLPDRLMAEEDESNKQYTNYVVQLNNGFGFEEIERWGPIDQVGPRENGGDENFFWNNISWVCDDDFGTGIKGYGTLVRIQDINGDGLPDRITRIPAPNDNPTGGPTIWRVQLNTGSGLAAPINWGPVTTQGNTTDSFLSAIERTSTYVTGEHASSLTGETYVDFLDINGDKLPDRVMRQYHPTLNGMGQSIGYDHFVVQLNKGPYPDLLRAVNNGTGGRVEVTYQASTQHDNRDKDWTVDPWTEGAKSLLPFPVFTVATETVFDGLGNTSQTTYTYKGGMYDHVEREFRGFCRVAVTDPLGAKTVQWFHQSGGRNETAKGEYNDAACPTKKGMPFRVERWGSDNKLYSLTLDKVEETMLAPGVCFAYVTKTIQFDYADGVNYRATAVRREYDVTANVLSSTGNLLKETRYGEIQLTGLADHSWTEIENVNKWIEIGNDEVYSHTTYYGVGTTSFPPGWNQDIKDKPATHRTTSDSAGTQILDESLFDYDGTSGNLLVRRDRICAGSYATNGFAYDAYGNVFRHTNEVGVVTATTYDAATQTFPYQESINGGFITTTIYDPRSGLVTDTTAPSGLRTKDIYDEFYRLKESRVSSQPNIEPDVWTVKYDYNLGGIVGGMSQNYVKLTKNNALVGDPGHETWTYTDGLGRVIQTRMEAEPQAGFTSPFRVTDVVYDSRGETKFQTLHAFGEGSTFTLPTGVKACTFTEHDALGRPFRITPCVDVTFVNGLPSGAPSIPPGEADSPLGPMTLAFEEGIEPWVLIKTDEENKVRKFYTDAFGRTNRIVEVTGAGNYTTLFEHDKLGRLARVTDHAGGVIEWAYDDLNRAVAMSDPHLGVWTWRRDFAGRVREQLDGRGNLTKFFYTNPAGVQDSLGRLMRKEIYDSANALEETATYFYDAANSSVGFPVYDGQLAAVTDGQGWHKFGYDVRGRATNQQRFLSINNSAYSTELVFDDADRVQTVLYPGSIAKVRNTYDSGAMLATVQQVDVLTGAPIGAPAYTSRGYTALGQPKGAAFGNGVETSLGYFACSKRVERLRAFQGGTDVQSLTYKYTAANNVRAITDWVRPSGSASATLSATVYDDLHCLKSVTGPGFGTLTYDYDPVGNMTLNGEAGAGTYNYGTARPQAVKSANGIGYTYDPCGNMTLRGAQRLDYDARNRLVSVSANGTTTATFGYADSGERLWKQTSAGLHVWIDAIYEVRNGVARFHILANGKRIAAIEPGTATTHYQHGDHLGSASILTSAAGAEARHWEYSPYGRERFASLPGYAVSHRFTGQVLDDETGLYYYNARYYDPNLGRFIQADTLIADFGDPQSFNRYAYVRNNPLKYVDPSGHWFESFIEIASLGVGIKSLVSNIRQGNVWSAVVDSVGIVADGAALVVPVVPGGVGLGIKAARATQKVERVVNKADNVKSAVEAAASGDVSALAQQAGGKALGVAANKTLGNVATQPGNAKGRWIKGEGAPPGKSSEESVWGAIEAKKDWSVTRGGVHTTDETGQTRVFDGVAHSPRGKNIGLEVKSGTSRKTADQRDFDKRINSGESTAVGTGQNKGVVIDRVKEIRRPGE